MDVVDEVAGRIPASRDGACLRVGVDGPDGSGKTFFAERLAGAVRALGRPVVRVSIDDFHNVREVRYRQGRTSPRGFWEDSYNYERFRADVLEPFGPGGSRRYRTAAHDLATDEVLYPDRQEAAPGTVLIVDGLFLHRDEIGQVWDLSVFLDVPFRETARRMAERDGTEPDPDHPSMRRYVEAQRRYFATCSPQRRADILIDNADFGAPRIVGG
ncbi:uridine kinase [Actinoplanes octamycinicus]|uniref:Uridine kinase n=1 Tax=Actinoplanes octamycinicus TaxID=135948 RepID=A0A7W7M9I4_9ACTN|nr:uridine kinase [Actinoplanes octamycinicus]MBB4741855.1 uridine kinase [Actinoplanes octamycinicus]GIE60619.1 uridine kinase [Actinoplanes octamycinicus]